MLERFPSHPAAEVFVRQQVDWMTAGTVAAARSELPAYAFRRDLYWLDGFDLPPGRRGRPVIVGAVQAVGARILGAVERCGRQRRRLKRSFTAYPAYHATNTRGPRSTAGAGVVEALRRRQRLAVKDGASVRFGVVSGVIAGSAPV